MIVAEASRDLTGTVARMTQRLIHRGPDDGGVVCFDAAGEAASIRLGNAGAPIPTLRTPARLALGARRLAIVDLSRRGRQPLASADGRAWIVFNGEIYNHAALREELRGAGHEFRSDTDTEVALL
ncbi:MAG: hypothetical protein V3T70_01660, partial [Phycisphaerae bacterium]